jgi:hypothetical protein
VPRHAAESALDASSKQHGTQHTERVRSACPQPFNVLKNFTNKPIEKRKGIAVVRNLEPPPFVPPALPDRAHSGGTRMGTAAEGKTESMLQAVDDDDDFMANLDIDRSPLSCTYETCLPLLPYLSPCERKR